MRVYLSGPIQSMPSIREARELFAFGEVQLRALGHEPLNPFDVFPGPGCRCADDAHTWGCSLRGDLIAMLTECQAIAMLPGWPRSHGARLELSVAAACGLEVIVL